MKHIFYLMTIAPLMFEFYTICDVYKVHSFMKTMRNTKSDELNSTQKSLQIYCLVYFIWTFIGLITFQWIVFIFLLLTSIIPKKYVIIRFIDSIISAFILLFIIINAYHLKIDVLKYLLDLLN